MLNHVSFIGFLKKHLLIKQAASTSLRKWLGTLYVGALLVILPPIYYSLDVRTYTSDPPREESILKGRIELKVVKHKSTSATQIDLVTNKQRLSLSCGAPAYVDCYPGVERHEGLQVTATVRQLSGESAVLQRLELESTGQVLVDQKFFEARRARLKDSSRTLSAFFSICGVLLLGVAVFNIKNGK